MPRLLHVAPSVARTVRRTTHVVAATLAFVGLASAADARRHVAPSPTPVATAPAPAATPLSEGARLAVMRGELETIAREAPGRLGLAVVDIATNQRFAIRGDEKFPLASTVKLPIAIVAYRLADQHKLDLDDRVSVKRGDFRRGPQEIARAHPFGAAYAYWQLVRAMLVTSDNTASDVVLRAVGGASAVDGFLHRLHVRDFTIRYSEANLAANADAHRTFEQGGDNVGTPNAMADLLTGLDMQRFTLVDATNELLLHLDDVATGAERLRAGLPATLRLAHKTGTSATVDGVTDATNDVGLVTLPNGRRVAVVAFLALSRADETTREATLARVARAVAAAYAP
ncbi:MAG: class A beta-lactamase [Vulcanimicrobiaceae bacterium]